MNPKDLRCLEHIVEHCTDIQEFVERVGGTFDSFEKDKMCYNAVFIKLEQIGEIVKNLSYDFRHETEQVIPWKAIAGNRDPIAHGYAKVSLKRTWETVVNDVPQLLRFCQDTLSYNDKSYGIAAYIDEHQDDATERDADVQR